MPVNGELPGVSNGMCGVHSAAWPACDSGGGLLHQEAQPCRVIEDIGDHSASTRTETVIDIWQGDILHGTIIPYIPSRQTRRLPYRQPLAPVG